MLGSPTIVNAIFDELWRGLYRIKVALLSLRWHACADLSNIKYFIACFVVVAQAVAFRVAIVVCFVPIVFLSRPFPLLNSLAESKSVTVSRRQLLSFIFSSRLLYTYIHTYIHTCCIFITHLHKEFCYGSSVGNFYFNYVTTSTSALAHCASACVCAKRTLKCISRDGEQDKGIFL
ncbi:unnamed protein product [Ceratitis capitata]|uniref:(Mediterranean fruit fly) hypothetical protein n=1 Tax=Ceratitis capitata TaxID=7213 RepID=A0A811V4C9_CERCA|nr:unnamed protein product [Ceratitis capitata]